jgi:hypothetical protein
MDKETVVYIHNGVLLTHKKNEIMAFAGKWMELEIMRFKQSKPGYER